MSPIPDLSFLEQWFYPQSSYTSGIVPQTAYEAGTAHPLYQRRREVIFILWVDVYCKPWSLGCPRACSSRGQQRDTTNELVGSSKVWQHPDTAQLLFSLPRSLMSEVTVQSQLCSPADWQCFIPLSVIKMGFFFSTILSHYKFCSSRGKQLICSQIVPDRDFKSFYIGCEEGNLVFAECAQPIHLH